MAGEWMITLAPIAGLAGDVTAQVVAAHLFRGRVAGSIVAGAVCGVGVTVVAAALGGSSSFPAALSAPDWAVGILTYAALAFGYWAFLNLNITSIRIRLLQEILRAPGGIAQGELLTRYSPDEYLRCRLRRLENGGQLSFENGCWRLRSRTLLRAAQLMAALRVVLLPARARQLEGNSR